MEVDALIPLIAKSVEVALDAKLSMFWDRLVGVLRSQLGPNKPSEDDMVARGVDTLHPIHR